jgi:hypothetical protein
VGIDDVADGLYAVAPDAFVATRTAAVAEARARGDKTAAAALGKLTKPTIVAWLVNRLSRSHRAEIEGLVSLGTEIRAATGAGDGPALRELAQRRKRNLAGLSAAARAVAADAGQTLGADSLREVEATLTAVVADPAAAEAVLAGRLTVALGFAGLGFDEGAIPPEQPSPRERPASTPSGGAAVRAPRAKPSTVTPSQAPPERSRAVEEAELALATARLHYADADAELAVAEDALKEAEQAGVAAAEAHRAATEALATARADVTDARQDRGVADQAVTRAIRALERASRRRTP